MQFHISQDLLEQARTRLSGRASLFWVLGGAGAGKSTVCNWLSARYDIPVYRMDDHIYGDYHDRFSQARHPASFAWSTAFNPLAWLLNLSWDEFDAFNQAALPEYLAVFAQDAALFVDGGFCNPALLAQVVPVRQIVCVAVPARTSEAVWDGDPERRAMKEEICQLPDGERLWQTFLDFDHGIAQTIVREAQTCGIHVCERTAAEPVAAFADRLARTLGIKAVRPDSITP